MVGDSGEATLKLLYVNLIVSPCAIVFDPWWFTKEYGISTRVALETDDRSSGSKLRGFKAKGFKNISWKETSEIFLKLAIYVLCHLIVGVP